MCFNKVICLLLFIAIVSSAKAQDANMNTLDSFSAKFISSIRTKEKERAFLVTDRNVFAAGEYVWYKTFLLGAISQKPTNKSKYLFVDVVNDKDSIIKHAILDATNRQLSSRIALPDSLPTGYYWLRAYTKQMAMHDSNEIAVKPLYVFAKTTDNVVIKNKKSASPGDIPTLTFFPEGGSIMTGINTIIGLQVTNDKGEPLHLDGIIKDNRDTIVAHFSTDRNGLAKFEFEPSGYRKYKAVVSFNGKETSYFLPAFDFRAGQISVSHQPGSYKLRILLGDSIFTKETSTYIIGISKDSLVFAAIGKGLYEVSVEESKLPQGITTYYLFSKDFKLLSERSVYVNNGNLHVSVTTDKSNYAKREKIALNLSVTDAMQHAVPSLLSVSISDSLFTIKQNACSSNTAFNVQSVDDFFLADNRCFTDEDIDLMMLAKNSTYQRLNTFATKQTMVNDESLLFINGIVLNNKNEPLPDRSVMLFSNTGGTDLFLMDTTNEQGRFQFPIYHNPDSLQIAMEIKDLNNNRVINSKVILDAISFPKLKTPAALKQYLDEDPRKSRQKINTYTNAAFINAEGKQLTPVSVSTVSDYDESKRVSPYSSILTAKDLDGKSPLDIVILRISGLQLLNGYLVIHGLNSFQSPSPASEPLVLVEGVEIPLTSSASGVGIVSPVMSYLHGLNPKDVDFIEVLKDGNAANYGVRGANGVILISLTNKARELPENVNNMKTFRVSGVANAAVFPTTSYDHKDKKAASTADTRSTLFWNGNFLTAGSDNATLNIYTSDVPSTYNITVTGITKNGDTIYKTITVQSK